MRGCLYILSLLLFSNSFAQAPTVLQWQRNYGGSKHDLPNNFIILSDGSIVMLASSESNDGDITGHHPSINPTNDVVVLKTAAGGNVLWQRSYGGDGSDFGGNIIQTADGGFILVGSTQSNNGDVSGHHGVNGGPDVWVVKLDGAGNIMWQKCYGGSKADRGSDITATNGGYIITAETNSSDGDVSGLHGGGLWHDLWVFKIDLTGNILWQRCYGGSKAESNGKIIQTSDGAFVIASSTASSDGDVSTAPAAGRDAWILKISPSGAIIWDKCFGGNDTGDGIYDIIENGDGSLFMTGFTASTNLPGSFPRFFLSPGWPAYDGWALKVSAGGNLLWQKAFGGSHTDGIYDAVKTPDGGYLLCGFTASNDGIVCQKHFGEDLWLVKMDAACNIQWNRTYGGSQLDDGISTLLLSPAGDCYVFSHTSSSDGDISSSYGLFDLWLSRYTFTGVLISPSVTISSNKDSIRCPGEAVQFFATAVDGGTSPVYQWKLNGNDVGGNSSTISLNNLFETDLVTCVLTSNSPCVDIHTVSSNSIKIKVGRTVQPFLYGDTALCSYQKIEIKTNRRFVSYLWSNGSTEETITVKQPGTYWLQVVDRLQCVGRDSIVISTKPCIEGVFFPNAFTPNRDGRNDKFTPLMLADVKQYNFSVYDRWGRLVFSSSTLGQGWDGTLKDMPCDRGVYVWQCAYQLEGEAPASKKGTVLLIR